MIDKNVCPNCGQLYDNNLEKCPLCGTAAQVVAPDSPVQRKRITEAERRQRRADRKEAEQEARLRRKNDQIVQDAEEERLLEEEAARRKEEKRLKKEARRAARQGAPEEAVPYAPVSRAAGSGTPAPAREGRRPAIQEEYAAKDRTRVPRFFLVLSFLLLLVTLAVGGAYLLWKLDKFKLPIFDRLYEEHHQQTEAADPNSDPDTQEAPQTTEEDLGKAGACRSLTLEQNEITFDHAGALQQIVANTDPNPTADVRLYTSSDEKVAKVSSVGVVTAIGPGEAVITVTCGTKTATCQIHCDFEEGSGQIELPEDITELTLNRTDYDMTFFNAGESYVLTVTNVPAGTHVDWRSLDESVATVDESGHVFAVGPGTTQVIAKVGDLEVACWVRCSFTEDD